MTANYAEDEDILLEECIVVDVEVSSLMFYVESQGSIEDRNYSAYFFELQNLF